LRAYLFAERLANKGRDHLLHKDVLLLPDPMGLIFALQAIIKVDLTGRIGVELNKELMEWVVQFA
jgi:UDP-N-acetyl-D-mannosaminuronic acid transferase (WecB/TagA/CpsF family)